MRHILSAITFLILFLYAVLKRHYFSMYGRFSLTIQEAISYIPHSAMAWPVCLTVPPTVSSHTAANQQSENVLTPPVSSCLLLSSSVGNPRTFSPNYTYHAYHGSDMSAQITSAHYSNLCMHHTGEPVWARLKQTTPISTLLSSQIQINQLTSAKSIGVTRL